MSVLSKHQQVVLGAIAKEETVTNSFTLSGGTALAEFYLHHRYSEDLDFFTEQEFDPQAIDELQSKPIFSTHRQ